MSELTLESLGMTQEELQERIVAKACDQLLHNRYFDYEDEEEYRGNSPFHEAINERIKQAIDEKFTELADAHIMPHIAERIQNLVIDMTNQYGEKTGKSYTLIEYLVEMAGEYMLSEVDCYGKAKKKGRDGWDFKGVNSRIGYQVDKCLHGYIEKAMQEVISAGNKTLADALSETCKMKLTSIANELKVSVTQP